MKKILLLAMLGVSALSFAQGTTDGTFIEEGPNCPTPITPYIAAGLSMSSGNDFKATSYPSVEAGIMIENWSLGGVFGRNNLLSPSPEVIENYWWEVKTGLSYSVGIVSIYGVLGIGAYIDRDYGMFVEYGGGISKEFGNFGVFAQATSWDGTWYVTPGISYSFSK
jgi:hypothetical protein